jgi:cell division protein FtsZ
VRSITDLMVMPGLINLDFADVRSVMGEMGKAMMGTGEGEGDNRALEAAERAIANPLLDGVSMAGAKGVIISIIGGEDMKLLEVDEAANHIRELVDPEANIIWGSAFNPALEGKIRVSVVATGIEQSAEQAHQASQPISFARAPKKPVLPLPTEAELAEDAAAAPEPETGDYQPPRFEDEPEAEAPAEPAYEAPATPAAYEPDQGEEEEYDEDSLAEPAEDSEYGDRSPGYASLSGTRIERDPEGPATPTDDWDDEGEGGDELELTLEAGGEPEEAVEEDEEEPGPGGQDELLLDASRLAEADEPIQAGTPGRRRRLLGGGGGGDEGGEAGDGSEPPQRRAPAAAPTGGSTLFERMANLSRASSGNDEEEEEEDSGGSALRIPRFLGRQNNQ